MSGLSNSGGANEDAKDKLLAIRLGKEMQKMAEHELLMILTNGCGLPEPTTFPPKQKWRCGIGDLTACA